VKIVHAADLHLDSPLRGLSSYERAPLEEVRSATRRARSALVELCVEEEVAFLLIAGDLYDGDFRDYSTALNFIEQVARLKEVGTKVVWLRGNHDAANKMTRHLRSSAHVMEMSFEAPQTLVFEDEGIAIHGQGYESRDTTENIALSYPAPLGGLLNFGLLHTALDGREGHAPYAPCTSSQLGAKGYDYWALGHIHKREVVSQEPYIVFPGNLQGRHIKETGPKGATVIQVAHGSIAEVTHRALDVVRWEVIEVDVSTITHWADALDAATSEMARLRDKIGDRVLATRVRFVGASAVHGVLYKERTRLENELRAHAVDQGEIYLERVQLATTGQLAAEALASRHDALGALFRDIELLRADPVAQAEFWDSLVRPFSSISADLLQEEHFDPDEILREARGLLEGELFEASVEDEG
jgi:DNA repair exonuclease SbcCD nuclease subunit